jgi:hypothetical protein
VHQRRSDTYIEKTAESIGDLLDRRFVTVAKKVKPTTLGDYALTIRKHLKPALGAITAQDLTPTMVQRSHADYRNFEAIVAR